MIPIRGLRAPVSAQPRPTAPYRYSARRPRNAIWSDANKTRLAELWDTGLPVKQIAETLEISPSAVTGKAYRMGLTRRVNPNVGRA